MLPIQWPLLTERHINNFDKQTLRGILDSKRKPSDKPFQTLQALKIAETHHNAKQHTPFSLLQLSNRIIQQRKGVACSDGAEGRWQRICGWDNTDILLSLFNEEFLIQVHI